jgi:2,3-bisphosphoglycerate-independent phosphoglycerate mutase
VLEKLQTFDSWRILVLPDHPTNIATRKHGYAPTPFALAGTNVKPLGSAPYSERNAKQTGLYLERGHELMAHFLRGGDTRIL